MGSRTLDQPTKLRCPAPVGANSRTNHATSLLRRLARTRETTSLLRYFSSCLWLKKKKKKAPAIVPHTSGNGCNQYRGIVMVTDHGFSYIYNNIVQLCLSLSFCLFIYPYMYSYHQYIYTQIDSEAPDVYVLVQLPEYAT